MLHFGSDQPGNTYYFLPLSIYLFGIVSPYIRSSSLLAQYSTQGQGAKGGNDVFSLLWNNFILSVFMEKANNQGPLGECVVVIDNCGGKNRTFLALL